MVIALPDTMLPHGPRWFEWMVLVMVAVVMVMTPR